MNVRIVEDEDGFAALSGPWRELAEASGARPFQEFGWAAAWMKTIGTTCGRRLRVATLWDGARLVALLPLVARWYNGIRILEWIGARSTDYCDAIVAPDVDGRSALRQMWEELKRRGGFDIVRLGQVRTDATVNGLVDDLQPWVETRENTFGIPITWANGSEWLEDHSRETRRRVSRNLRRMSHMGFAVHIWQPTEPLDPLVEAVIQQKLAWIEANHLSSALAEPQGVQFIRSMTAAMAASGALHLSAVRSKDRIAAVHLGFLRGDTLYGYIASYDAALAKCSFGTTLRESLIMWACDHGVRCYDLLLGAHEYKTQYRTTPQAIRTLVIPHSALGSAALRVYRWRKERTPVVTPRWLPLPGRLGAKHID